MPPVIFSQDITVHRGEIYLITSQESRVIVSSQTRNWHVTIIYLLLSTNHEQMITLCKWSTIQTIAENNCNRSSCKSLRKRSITHGYNRH